MPAKHRFCWCLGGFAPSGPPEISYGIENGGMTLKPMTADLPMPDDEELNALFTELVDELDLDKPHRDAMFNLPPEKKWQIYCSKKRDEDDPNSANWPDYYIERINTMSNVFFAYDDDEIESRSKTVDSLKTALRTQPMSFVTRFIELGGLQCLLNFLSAMDYKTAESSIHTSTIGCLKALMNNSQGRAHVLAHPNCINVIAQSLATDNIKAKVAVLEILGAVCLVPGGHKKVLHAMIHYQKYACERTRFQSLIYDLDRNTGVYKDELSLKTAIMSFINAALKYGPGQDHLEFRMHLRYEFLMLGIQPIIDKLRTHENATLDRHLDFFEMVRSEDEKQLAKKFEVTHVDSRSASSMFDLLKKKLNFSMGYSHFLSILYHFLHLPFGNGAASQYWQLIDRIVQQIVLQTKDGSNLDQAPLDVDVKKIIRQLANENEIKAVQQKIREVQKENDELASRLGKKERECDIKAQEKDELMSTLSKMRTKLERESLAHLEAKQQIVQLTEQLNEMQQMIDAERRERIKLEHAVKTGSLPDDAKMGFNVAAYSFATSTATPHPVPTATSAPKIPSPQGEMGPVPPPPPPPMAGGGPPPPPPPPGPPGAPPPPPMMMMMTSMPGVAVKQKNIPKPSHPLKSFNWSKLPETKLQGTVWNEIDDCKLYQCLDLSDLERNFSAYQRQDLDSMPICDNEVIKAKAKELSVIDGRRAQNCTILLSRLKMTNRELTQAMMSMDEAEELPKDMCEQLLKFVPTPEEAQLLSEHAQEIEQMAKADRFLLEMSRIDHYEQRLRALYFKKKFTERMNETKPKVDDVLEASKEMIRTKKLRRLLELVLAFGNFMNRGQRGNAFGFKLSSLNKIIDTKSSMNRKVTLLHYLCLTIESKFPEILNLEEGLSHVKNAAKVNLGDLESEINVLKTGIQDIEKEVDYCKNRVTNNSGRDKFISVMSNFITVAAINFSELEDQYAEMKQRFEKVVRLFGEDPRKAQPDEFFGTFDLFLTSYTDARAENIKIRRQMEEEEKRAKIEAQLRSEREKQRANRNVLTKAKSMGTNGRIESKEAGEFDDLISALRTGDVFGEEVAKMKRNRRRGSASMANGDCRERVGKLVS